VGYLDELKRRADEARLRDGVDIVALQRNAQLTDAACQSAARYLSTLAQQLDVLQPMSRAVFRFDSRTSFSGLRLRDFRTDSRLKRLRDAEVFDHVVLGFELRTGQHVKLSRDFPPAIEKLEARLRQCGTPFESEIVRNLDNGKFEEKRFEFVADFRGAVRMLPDHDRAWIHFEIVNLEGFETVSVDFPAFEVGSARLDELARWLVGEPHRFLEGGQNLRVVEA